MSSGYLNKDDFFKACGPVALTFDDISLATCYSDVLPKDTKLGVNLGMGLELGIPIISADMDTVTESEMAIGMALQGGMGLIHYNMSEEAQVAELRRVKERAEELVCGVAISAIRKENGELDSERILAHIRNLVDAGVDAIAVSTAHGHSVGVGETVRLLRGAFKDLCIIAGNVTSGEGVEYLADCGANAVKIGQGPGSICTTRVVAGVGIPQMTALYEASKSAKKSGVAIIADGGMSKSGDIVKALTLADAVICGGMFAGCEESPGKTVEVDGKRYKEYRGMGSLKAMKAGSAARYGHSKKDSFRKVSAEGVEALKEVEGPVEEKLAQLVGGIQSGLGYLGAKNLEELKDKARYVRLTGAGLWESKPHDIVEIK